MKTKGFTLIELMIVVVIIGIVASMALPNLLSARLSANEATAIATCRAIAAAQSQFQKGARADADGDGWGEFGTLGEMTASKGVRQSTTPIRPPVLSTAFKFVNPTGEAGRYGYLFRIFLPDPAGKGLGEIPGGGAPVGIDGQLAENVWAVYAWPIDYGQSGRRAFFMGYGGTITFAESPSYSGPGNGPAPGAAMQNDGGDADSLTGQVAASVTGRDGLMWRVAGK